MQPQPHERDLVVGVTGSGKTTLVRQRVAGIRRVVLWAPKGDFQLAERCAGVDEAAALAPHWKRPVTVRAVVVPQWSGDLDEQLDALCEVLWWVRNVHLVIEECGLLDPRRPKRHLGRLIAVGRERSLTATFVAQRAVQVDATSRSQVSRVTTFRQSHPADVEALSELMGPEAEKVTGLPRFEFLEWEPERGVRHGRTEK